jgi:hypothetical protein
MEEVFGFVPVGGTKTKAAEISGFCSIISVIELYRIYTRLLNKFFYLLVAMCLSKCS